ncbi:MAG: hypothetical protein HZY79_13850 [Rhodoblastus sp.]|nr:MAG: hypothetical protein HZY79_13850 [Rhodoblastus sp.]
MSLHERSLAANANPQAAERRAERRSRCFIQGRIQFPDRARTLDVTIRNLGDHGALLEAEGLDRLPSQFALTLTARAVTRHAQLRWSNFGHAGVALRAAETAP